MGEYPWSRAIPAALSRGMLVQGGLVLVMLLFGNCAKSPKPVSGLPSEAVPPVSSSTAEKSDVTRGMPPQAEPDFSTNLRILKSFLNSQQDKDALLETQVALARTYEQAGERDEALKVYHDVVKETSPSLSTSKDFTHQATERIASLESRTVQAQQPEKRSVAVLIRPSTVPPRKQWEQWLGELREAGVTVLILEAGTKPVEGKRPSHVRPTASTSTGTSPGVYFQTTWAPVKKPTLNQIVPLAQKKGLAVFAAVTLRRMPWLEPTVGWADWVYRLDTNRLERSQALDIFNPAVQDYHAGFLADLVKSGIDGIFFRADAPMGPFEGLSRFGLAGFQRQYDIQLNARILFPPRTQTGRRPNSQGSELTSRFSPAYWKWEGWKVREGLQVMGRYVTALRRTAPRLEIAVEVHPEAISRPLAAMVHYSEDVVEAKQLGFQYLVTLPGSPENGDEKLSAKSDSASTNTDLPGSHFISQALDIIEEPHALWVMHNLPPGRVPNVGAVIAEQNNQVPVPKGVGVLYTLGTSALP